MGALTDQVALVTGSSRGIGAAIAITFAKAGAQVVLHGRDEAALASVRTRITDIGGQATSVTGDVTLAADLARMREQIIEGYGHLDLLVANAGSSGSRPTPIEDITEESWRADIDLNLTSTFRTVKCFLPGMKERGSGSIITVSSAAGRRPSGRTLVAYGAAKAGVQIFTQDLTAQVGPYGIRANCLAPETILTETSEQWIPADVQRSLAESTRCVGSVRPKTLPGQRCSSRPTSRTGSPVSSTTSRAVLYWFRPRIGPGVQLGGSPTSTLSLSRMQVNSSTALSVVDRRRKDASSRGPTAGRSLYLSAADPDVQSNGDEFRSWSQSLLHRSTALEGNDMTATYTFDVFSSLDGYGSYGPGGDWGGYWGKQGPELLDHRLASFGHEQRMVFGATTFRQFVQMLAESTEESEVRDPWVTRMRNMPATVVSSTLEGPLDWPDATIVSGDAVDIVARFKEESEVPLRSHGSLSLNWALMAAGLVDRVQVTLFPVITGKTGTDPIFGGAADFDLELVESRTLDGHIQELIYRPTLH